MTGAKTYRSRIDGWVAGRRVQEGDLIDLTLDAAVCEPVAAIAPDPQIDVAQNSPVNTIVKRPKRAKSGVSE